jgi:hypothetical protein
MMDSPFIGYWDAVEAIRKPVLAAVSGYCFGGGCELAMICDLVVASETAVFGQPEINLGIIPGAGGTQRLTRAVGKAVAMDMILSGRRINAQEALQFGLVSRVFPAASFQEEVLKLAGEIASKAPVALRWRRKRSIAPTPAAWPRACSSSAAPSTCSSPQKIRKRAWPRLWKSVHRCGRDGSASVQVAPKWGAEGLLHVGGRMAHVVCCQHSGNGTDRVP